MNLNLLTETKRNLAWNVRVQLRRLSVTETLGAQLYGLPKFEFKDFLAAPETYPSQERVLFEHINHGSTYTNGLIDPIVRRLSRAVLFQLDEKRREYYVS